MIRNLTVVGTVTVMLFAAGWSQAEVCEIANGSFEMDGQIVDIVEQEPNGWVVSVPSGKFVGKTDASWSTEGTLSLLLFSQWFKPFAAGDVATVSQQLNLRDVNEIRFDLRLDTYTGLDWDPNNAAAVVLIDGDVVWKPNFAVSKIRGVHEGQSYLVEERYRDDDMHTLSFGLMIKVDTQDGFFEFYRVWWDSISCTVYCGGGGLLAGDTNRDCFVDAGDLQAIAAGWLTDVDPFDRRNLSGEGDTEGYGVVNFMDFAFYAEGWDGNTADLHAFTKRWLTEAELDDQYNLFKDNDVNPSGIVNFYDLAIFAETWLGSSYIQEE